MFEALRRFLAYCGSPAPTRRRRSITLRIEELENRWVPSTLLLNGNASLITPPQAPFLSSQAVTPPVAATPVASPAPSTPTPSDNGGSQTQEVDATFAASPIDFNQTGSVAQFNPTLGTLTSVEIIQEGTLTGHVIVENRDTQPQNVSATIQGTLTLQAGNVTVKSNPSVQEGGQVAAFDNSTDMTGPDTTDFGSKSATDTQSTTLSSSTTDLSAFIGTGQLSLTESGTATGQVQGPGSLLALLDTQGSANVRVLYTYTPPPPGSLSGFVYLDNNQDGVRDGGDWAMPGVTVTLQGNGVNTSLQTDSNGAYSFANLVPGTYTITKTPPAGYDEGTNNVGSLGGSVNGDTFTVTVPPGGNGTDYNFGEITLPSPPPNVQPTPTPQTPPPDSPPPGPSSNLTGLLTKRLFVGGGWKSFM